MKARICWVYFHKWLTCYIKDREVQFGVYNPGQTFWDTSHFCRQMVFVSTSTLLPPKQCWVFFLFNPSTTCQHCLEGGGEGENVIKNYKSLSLGSILLSVPKTFGQHCSQGTWIVFFVKTLYSPSASLNSPRRNTNGTSKLLGQPEKRAYGRGERWISPITSKILFCSQ